MKIKIWKYIPGVANSSESENKKRKISNEENLKPDQKKTHPIKEMPEPSDKKGLQRFLRMVQYIAKFIPDLSTITAPYVS